MRNFFKLGVLEEEKKKRRHVVKMNLNIDALLNAIEGLRSESIQCRTIHIPIYTSQKSPIALFKVNTLLADPKKGVAI